MQLKKILSGGGLAALATAYAITPAVAATVVVTPISTQSWSDTGTTSGGLVEFVADGDTAYGTAALHLKNDSTNEARSRYSHDADIALSDINQLSYNSKTLAGPDYAAPSFYLAVDLDNDGDVDTSLVHEPYWQNAGSPDPSPVVHGSWQTWDVDQGLFWSNQTVAPLLTAGAGGPPFYTLAQVKAAYPDAKVKAFGVHIGTYNPNYDVLVDGITVNDTLYDFELVAISLPTSKDACKAGGYMNLTDSTGTVFKNQGQCVSYFNHMH